MIDPRAFLADAQKLVVKLEKDLRARCDNRSAVGQAIEVEYQRARDAGRTGQTLEGWRADAITQQAVAWVLSCVFVRFLEDNRLIDPPKLAGPGARLNRARDEYERYCRTHPHDTDREYLLTIFDALAKRAATRDLFGEHNPVRPFPVWLSPDAARDLILPFFQKVEGSGHLVHDFTDPSLETRFLGDLYQDLSEAARKKYALLQTPLFVEEFILERTLTPAIETFGLDLVRLIDPACGCGHFLLGAFGQLLDAWARREPGTPRCQLVPRCLDAIHGVDLNPYAVAIARLRLLLAAWQACGVTSRTNVPDFRLNLACGDSLLQGGTKAMPGSLGVASMGHHSQPEDLEEVERLLRPGSYHAVVANPPYITPRDRHVNDKYRERYSVCYRQYSLAVPFLQRIFDLACEGGFTGQITANSFMKREFGKKLITGFFPTVDLTHVLDTSGAYIPGHGTPTVILFGRCRPPTTSTIRTVMGIRGEPNTPEDPASGQVWSDIVARVDQPGSQGTFVSVADAPRQNFHKHPWSIGGGGAAELKAQIEQAAAHPLTVLTNDIGFVCITKADEIFAQPEHVFRRYRCERERIKAFGMGEELRDWSMVSGTSVIFPYDEKIETIDLSKMPSIHRFLWPYRVELENRKVFSGQTYRAAGKPWHEYGQIPVERARVPRALVFAFVASHNHFMLDRSGKVFKQSAPVIKLPATATEDEHLALLGLLNSSTVCFWLKQVSHQKQLVGGDGVRVESRARVPYEFAGAQIEGCPIPAAWKEGPLRDRLLAITRELDTLSQSLTVLTASEAIERALSVKTSVQKIWKEYSSRRQQIRARMIVLQEEIDFTVYVMFGLGEESLLCDPATLPEVPLEAGCRPFDILRGQNEDGFTVPPRIPADWPEPIRQLWQKRMEAIQKSSELRLIEDSHYKRRWIGRQGLFNHTQKRDELAAACEQWLLDRLESWFDLDGRLNDTGKSTAKVAVSLLSMARLADLAGRDQTFQTVAAWYRGRSDFDMVELVTELVGSESVPLLPVLRCKPSGLDKRRAWERTWELQRQEDAGLAPLNAALADLLDKEKIGPILPPPKYRATDFQGSTFWRLRGPLDVPKERWVSFPHCEGADGVPLIAWAGYDHLQLAKAIRSHYVRVQQQESGRDDPRLLPLLACLVELLPWLKQWHNEYDADQGMAMGDDYEGFVQDEARQMGRTIEEVRAWRPPRKKTFRKAGKPPGKKEK